MAAVPKSGIPSLATPLPTHENRTHGYAAAAIAAGDACYISGTASDGQPLFTKASGAAANAAAVVEGFAAGDAAAGDGVTLYRGDVHMHYGSGLTPGAGYYLSGTTAGGLDTATSTGGTEIIARAVSTSVIRCIGNR